MNVRVNLTTSITDGTEVVFRSPVDCSQVTGLVVYYDGGSKEFAFADAHGNNVGDIDHLFAENVVVKVILDVTHAMAFVQNADTNAYIERTFIKTVNGVAPDENGNVVVDGGVSDSEKSLILSLFRNAAYTADMSATFAQLEALWGDSGEVPDEPEEPDVPVVTLTSISATYSGGDVPVGTAVTDLTGIVVTAHYSDGTSKAVTDYTISGTIAEGSNTITVSYGGMTTTFAVTGVAEEEPHTHSYTSSVTKVATCEVDGVRTYTCSCGHSYTEAIPATGHNYVDGTCTKCGAADPDYEEPNAISVRYEMPAETIFDGTNYIDTGVTLVDEDRDWTICLDYTPTAKTGRPFDISGNATGCLNMKMRGGYFWDLHLVTEYIDISTQNENMKVVLTHTAGSANVNVAYVTASKELSNHVFTNYEPQSTNFKSAKNIILGADYTKANNFAKGTMHRFVVYNGVLDETAINEFLAHTGSGDSGEDSGGDSGGNASTDPVYQLAQATTFDGAKSIDTGYILNDVDKDWTILSEYDPTARSGVLFDASKNANLFGPYFILSGDYFYAGGSRLQAITADGIATFKIIATHAKASNAVTIHIFKTDTEAPNTYELSCPNYTSTQHSIGNTNTMKIGSKFTGDGNYFKGTIRRFEVYERVISVDEINAFMEVSA